MTGSPSRDHGARTLRLALVNDYPLVVAGLAAALQDWAGVEVVELDAGCVVALDVDVILCDTFGHVEGLGDFISRSDAPVLVFSFTHDAQAIAAAKSAGAAGYLSKTLTAEELVSAVRESLSGEFMVALGPPAEEPGPVVEAWPGKEAGLTYRESEVVAFICEGLSNQQIALALYLSINSVKTYIRTAYRKMDVATRPQAVLWGLHHGFVSRVERTTHPEE